MNRYWVALIVSVVFTGLLFAAIWIIRSQLPEPHSLDGYGREVTSREMLFINLVDLFLIWGWMLSPLCFVISFAVAANLSQSEVREKIPANSES